MEICEIRIPTYKRPQWLARAVQSALAQDYSAVRVIVLDDSPEREGREVVSSFNDPRVIYRPNSTNLGAAANIDLGFSKSPMADGVFFCVLDDDNWLQPSFVSENIQCLRQSGLSVCLRNQQVWEQRADETNATKETTRGRWFNEGRVELIEVYASSFFTEGISNGGLFWSLEAKTDFVVGADVTDAGLSECCRTLQIAEPIYFAAQPLAIFSLMSDAHRARAAARHREFGRGKQAIARFLLSTYGRDVVKSAQLIAARANAVKEFRLAMIDSLNFSVLLPSLNLETLSRLPKSIAKLSFVGNPLKKYLRKLSLLRSAHP